MIIEVLQIIVILLIAVVLHEYAHGWVAYKRGDSTAKLAGRLTLNPIKHIDPVGTIVVPFVLRLLNLPVFGWAKPVPVNFHNLHNPKKDMVWVAIAGPCVNIALAVIFSIFLRLTEVAFLHKFFTIAIIINLILAIFNLIPIPPLDGSRILMGLLPTNVARSYAQLEPFGLLIVLVCLNFGILDFIWNVVVFFAVQLGVNPAVLGT